jgi:hypothetical protein
MPILLLREVRVAIKKKKKCGILFLDRKEYQQQLNDEEKIKFFLYGIWKWVVSVRINSLKILDCMSPLFPIIIMEKGEEIIL